MDMRLRLTVMLSEIEVTAVNIEIEGRPGLALGKVTQQLLATLPAHPVPTSSSQFRCNGHMVPASQPLGLPPLIQARRSSSLHETSHQTDLLGFLRST